MIFGQIVSEIRARARLLAVVGAAFVVFLPTVDIVAVMLGGGSELSYTFGPGVSTCRYESVPCFTYVNLQIGNTGSRMQEQIRVDLRQLPQWANANHYVIKIVASNEPLMPPTVSVDADERTIDIAGLSPNQMITFQILVPRSLTRDDLESARPTIEARGRVIESSPKATALARAFRTAFAFLL